MNAQFDARREEFNYKLELLKQEMKTAQNGIKNYNEAQFKVKSVAIPVLVAFLTIGMDKHQPICLLTGAFVVIVFWVQDSYFQSIQRVYMTRAGEIESLINSGEFSEAFQRQSLSNPVPHIEAACKDWEKNKLTRMNAEFGATQNLLLYTPLLLLIIILWQISMTVWLGSRIIARH